MVLRKERFVDGAKDLDKLTLHADKPAATVADVLCLHGVLDSGVDSRLHDCCNKSCKQLLQTNKSIRRVLVGFAASSMGDELSALTVDSDEGTP